MSFVRRQPGSHEIRWDPEAGLLDPGELDRLDAVVHLAGAGIGSRRWSDSHKRRIRDSRVLGTTLLANAIAASGVPRTLLSGSAIGFYGDSEELVDENSRPGTDFLAGVAKEWEAATRAAEAAGVRVVHLRTGIVLSATGGALKKMLPLFKLGLGGRFGNGRQWMSWISIDDEVGAIAHLLTSDIAGPVNLTAPEPVRNAEFAKTLGSVLRRPSAVPVPEFGPKLVLGEEMARSLLFGGQRVDPAMLRADGYKFRHAHLEEALRALLGRPTRPDPRP